MEYWVNPYGDIVYKNKNSKGQTVSLTIQYESYKDSVHWNVCLWIGKHSKGYQKLKQTGKDGLKSLLWAKKCIIDFINNIPKDKNKKHYLIVRWEDSKRRDAYRWGLKGLEFDTKRINGKICLCKFLG